MLTINIRNVRQVEYSFLLGHNDPSIAIICVLARQNLPFFLFFRGCACRLRLWHCRAIFGHDFVLEFQRWVWWWGVVCSAGKSDAVFVEQPASLMRLGKRSGWYQWRLLMTATDLWWFNERKCMPNCIGNGIDLDVYQYFVIFVVLFLFSNMLGLWARFHKRVIAGTVLAIPYM